MVAVGWTLGGTYEKATFYFDEAPSLRGTDPSQDLAQNPKWIRVPASLEMEIKTQTCDTAMKHTRTHEYACVFMDHKNTGNILQCYFYGCHAFHGLLQEEQNNLWSEGDSADTPVQHTVYIDTHVSILRDSVANPVCDASYSLAHSVSENQGRES